MSKAEQMKQMHDEQQQADHMARALNLQPGALQCGGNQLVFRQPVQKERKVKWTTSITPTQRDELKAMARSYGFAYSTSEFLGQIIDQLYHQYQQGNPR